MINYYAEFKRLKDLGIKIPEDKITGYFVKIGDNEPFISDKPQSDTINSKFETMKVVSIPITDTDTLADMVKEHRRILIDETMYEIGIHFTNAGSTIISLRACSLSREPKVVIKTNTLTKALLDMLIWVGENKEKV